MRISFWLELAIVTCLVLFAGGCASISGATKTPEEAVKARAQERWNAMVAGQFDKAYEYITPTGRGTLPLSIFRGRLGGVSWRGAKVTGAVCEAEVCDVTVMLDVEVLPNLPQQLSINEKWLLDGGKWWYVYRG